MRTISIIAAAAAGLLIGVTGTWWSMRHAAQTAPSAPSATSSAKKVLYWYDPMVPEQHFDKPGKSPFMDMQLVPKYTSGDADGDSGVVRIDPRQVQNLGVRTAKASRGSVTSRVHATGSIAFDERAVAVVQARVAGIVERLDVRAALTPVKEGQALLTLLAPDWTAAQEEYLSLRRMHSANLDDLRAAARRRLLLLGMSESQIRAIERSGQSQTRIAVTAPRDGVVAELSVREGATVAAGSPLLRINGLDTVWINAAVPETQIGLVAPTSPVSAKVRAFPGERFEGRIDALLPDIDPTTRTQTARIALKNPQHRLAPGMFAEIEFEAANPQRDEVLVPSEAVIVTGTRSVVIVAGGEGRFRAQEVRTGHDANGTTEILEGLKENETVVLSGQFLIDSEASLIGALARLGDGTQATPAPGAPDTVAHDAVSAEGVIERIEGDQWTIAADAVPALGMGAMTMTFDRGGITAGVMPGQRVRFSFVRNAAGGFQIKTLTIVEGKPGARPDGGSP